MKTKQTRQALGMTQAQFAEAMGVSQACVSQWEKGTKNPSRMALKLIEYLTK